MKVLITGASGFLGSHVVRGAVRRGLSVRALVRKNSSLANLEGLPVELCRGDICDRESVRQALSGCRWLFHMAAQYRFTSLHAEELLKTNIQGTRMVLEEAERAGLERIVYTSSTATIGIPKDGAPGNEGTEFSLEDLVGPYKRSKYLAEQVVLELAGQGLPVVVVNPSAPVGTYDSKPTPTGRFILDFLNRKLFAYTDTGLNLVDAEDVAEGHFLAAEKGKIGERYILGNRNMEFRAILEVLAGITGLRAPRLRLPHAAVLFMAYANHLFSRGLLGREPGIPLEGVKLARKKMFFDPAKACRELGLPQTPVEQALEKAVRWYRDHGYVR